MNIKDDVTPQDDETLARLAVQQRNAFTILYQRYAQRIYACHLAQTGDQHTAEDLTSQTFLVALEGIHGYRGSGSFAAWLFGIARNLRRNHYRRQPTTTDLQAAEALPDPRPEPDEIASLRQEIARLMDSLRTLSPDRAEAIALRLIAGLDTATTARVMGKSPAAVKMLLLRGLADLNRKMEVP